MQAKRGFGKGTELVISSAYCSSHFCISLLFRMAALVFAAVAAVSVGAVAEAPAVGTNAPEFTLTTNEGKQASLKNFRGKWVVLYFYPKDFTSGCTLEAHNFQTDLARYKAMHAVILGVSVDTAESHKSFCEKEGLSFKLLADTDMTVSEAYGSMMDRPGVKLSARNTFIIDPDGKNQKRVTSFKAGSIFCVAWLPGSRHIVFAHNPRPNPDSADLLSVSIDAGEIRRLTLVPKGIFSSCSVSADGNRLVGTARSY